MRHHESRAGLLVRGSSNETARARARLAVVATDHVTAKELEQLSGAWTRRLEENLANAAFSAAELVELAERHRTLALVAESPGQRRAAITIAERYENAARERAAVRG